MAALAPDKPALMTLEAGVKGQVLMPDHPSYGPARTLFNRMIDRKPAVIVRPSDTADVIAAVNFARTSGLEISIKGGGHGVSGTAICDGGLTIDMSAMNRVTVDPAARVVRAEAGATWGLLDAEMQKHGFAV